MMGIIKNIKNNGILFILLLIYITLVIFTPYIKIAGRENFEVTFILTILFVFLLPYAVKESFYEKNRSIRIIALLLSAIFLTDTISIVNFIIHNGFVNIISNIVPNIKVGLYILLAIAILPAGIDEDNHRFFLYKFLPALAFLIALVGIMQRTNLFNFNEWFTGYYISSESGRAVIDSLIEKQEWRRVLGTLSNPNFYSLQLMVLMACITSNIVHADDLKHKAVNLIIDIMLFLSLIFTQSRTGIAVVIMVFFYFMIVQTIKGGRKNIIKYLIAFLVILIVIALAVKYMDLYYIFDIIKYKFDVNSVNDRIKHWIEAINLFKFHPIVGIGPVIGVYYSSVDNEYIHILRNYGALGLLAHLSLYIYIFVATLKDIIRKSTSTMVRHYAMSVNLSVLAVLITNITMATFYHWRNFILLLFISLMWSKVRDY
ncbi:O-antigen ligase [Oxobacter pfennigii]|uniref:O-antigen ligase n=1 Tax=Oxobacter pfennigii TaxID=36849 RepID=A0A0P8WBR3_9CLOT|nr:O-antigen ligase family protein [Oxobacter pfennigii]KPU45361.1 O-antigen ligase [Oxobacter pfennigii]